MLDGLRSHASSLGAKILLLILLAAFAFWGIGDIVRRPGHNVDIAAVGNHTISLERFQRELKRQNDTLRETLGDRYSPEMAKKLGVTRLVLHRLINDELLKRESEALHLVPGDTEVVRQIRSSPSFQDSKGNFDKNRFEAALRSGGMSENTFVEQRRQDIAANLLMETLTSTIPIPPVAAKMLYQARAEERSAVFYVVGPSVVSTIAQPTPEQTQNYYQNHQHEFSAPELRSVSYVTFKGEDVHKSALSDEALKAAYQERIDEFKRPERRTVDQLLYSNEDEAKKAYDMLKGGAAFEQVAKTTDILNKNALSLGAVERGHIVEAAEEDVFAAKPGDITKPIQSPFGWHIFRITKIEAPSTESFEEARPALEKDMKQHADDDALNKLANTLEDTLAAGSTLDEAANQLGLKVKTAGPMTRQGQTPEGAAIKDLPDLDKFLDIAFKTDEGTESSLAIAKNGTYYIVHVDKGTPEHIRALDEVRNVVVAKWQQEERAKRLAEIAGTIGQKMASAKDRDGIIATYKLKAVTSGPLKRTAQTSGDLVLPAQLMGNLFALKPGDATNIYQAKKDEYLIAVLRDITQSPVPDKQDKAMGSVEQELGTNMQNEIIEEYMDHLADKYPVSINMDLVASLENANADER